MNNFGDPPVSNLINCPASPTLNIVLEPSSFAAAKNGNDVTFIKSVELPPIVIPTASSPSICKSPELASNRILSVLPSSAFKVFWPICQLPTLPPSKRTLEPVIWPVSPLNIKLSLDDDIAVDVIAKPPIVPNVAVIPPWRNTLSVAKPNPGFEFPKTISELANPDKSPSLAF